jgi:hypothetical protein
LRNISSTYLLKFLLNMKQVNYLVLIICFSLFACIRGQESYSSSSVRNNTTHTINIFSYKNGLLDSTVTLALLPNSLLSLSKMKSSPGKKLGNPPPDTYGWFDSVKIVFDDTLSSIHLPYLDTSKCFKCISNTSARSFTNPNNWNLKIISETKNSYTTSYDYTFEEADYLAAK